MSECENCKRLEAELAQWKETAEYRLEMNIKLDSDYTDYWQTYGPLEHKERNRVKDVLEATHIE